MTQAIALPLVDHPKDISPDDRSFEDRQIERLCSGSQMARNFAADWLKEHGDSITADKIEKILNKKKLPEMAKREAGRVLLSLSHRHWDFARTIQGKLRRFLTIHKATHAKPLKARLSY
jgi:hypothetical protein